MAVQEAVAEEWLQADRLPDRRGLWPVGNLTGVTCNPPTTTDYTGTIGLPVPDRHPIRDDDGKEVPHRRARRDLHRARR